jgi:hypothetical protein
MASKPRKLSEEEVRAASRGKSQEVLGSQEAPREKKRPVQLSEEEVRAASQGKSEEILRSKQSPDS